MMTHLAEPVPGQLVDEGDVRFFRGRGRGGNFVGADPYAGAFLADAIIIELLMGAVAVRRIGGMFAQTQEGNGAFVGDEFLGGEDRTDRRSGV